MILLTDLAQWQKAPISSRSNRARSRPPRVGSLGDRAESRDLDYFMTVIENMAYSGMGARESNCQCPSAVTESRSAPNLSSARQIAGAHPFFPVGLTLASDISIDDAETCQ